VAIHHERGQMSMENLLHEVLNLLESVVAEW
jgi:hypothetical protein